MDLESKMQKKTLQTLEAHGFAFKCVAMNKRGIPDICACVDGVFFGVEVKRETKYQKILSRLSATQRQRLSEIDKNKGIALVVGSDDDLAFLSLLVESIKSKKKG